MLRFWLGLDILVVLDWMFWWSDIISGGLGPPLVVNAAYGEISKLKLDKIRLLGL